MGTYRIVSRAGVDYGCYRGETPEEAFAAMCVDAGDEPGSDTAGTVTDWTVTPEAALCPHGYTAADGECLECAAL